MSIVVIILVILIVGLTALLPMVARVNAQLFGRDRGGAVLIYVLVCVPRWVLLAILVRMAGGGVLAITLHVIAGVGSMVLLGVATGDIVKKPRPIAWAVPIGLPLVMCGWCVWRIWKPFLTTGV